MGNLVEPETPEWRPVQHFEADALLTGGPDCPDNLPLIDLVHRTLWLYQNKQAISPKLTALAGLAGGSNKIPYFDGADSMAMATLSAYARTLLDDADAAAARGTLGLDQVGNYSIATQVEAEAEADQVNNKYMTPLRVWQAFTKFLKSATETVAGVLRVATQAETNTGTADDRIVTPKKLRWGFAVSLTANGYIVFPTWLAGLVIQWQYTANITAGSSVVATFPIEFPTAMLCGIAAPRSFVADGNQTFSGAFSPISKSQAKIQNTSPVGVVVSFFVFTIGS